MAYKVVRSGRNGTSTGCYKSLDDAMRRAAMAHEDGMGYTTAVYKGSEKVAELHSSGKPKVYDERYAFVPIPNGDWHKRPTKYNVYKRI